MSLIVNVEEKHRENAYQVSLDGRLDSNTCGSCTHIVKELLDKSAKDIIFNLKRLNYINSMGLRLLFSTAKNLKSQSRNMIITNLQPQIAKVFEIIKELPSVPIFSSIEEADEYLDLMQRREIEKSSEK
jgi:anti-anti-sigma factor